MPSRVRSPRVSCTTRAEPAARGLGARSRSWTAIALVLTVACVVARPASAAAVEVGQPAPEFKLPSTKGGVISLADFRGKKWVLLEFYGADFSPT
jgi:AhpC/TSA family